MIAVNGFCLPLVASSPLPRHGGDRSRTGVQEGCRVLPWSTLDWTLFSVLCALERRSLFSRAQESLGDRCSSRLWYLEYSQNAKTRMEKERVGFSQRNAVREGRYRLPPIPDRTKRIQAWVFCIVEQWTGTKEESKQSTRVRAMLRRA